jgi:hypothetical protein
MYSRQHLTVTLMGQEGESTWSAKLNESPRTSSLTKTRFVSDPTFDYVSACVHYLDLTPPLHHVAYSALSSAFSSEWNTANSL